jgi:glycosyltransferase involved in cell wall biosynthesis
MPRFSIVIPVRNRAYTLYHTLKTCLNQHAFDDYEIIVSDNESEDNVAEMVREFNSDKIKYFRTCSFLSMTDNYNFALSKVTGEYILFLGSDDAICTHGLYFLDKIISITGEKIINWRDNCYCWPDYISFHGKNNLFLCKFNATIIRDAKNNVKKVVNGSGNMFDLPLLYVRSAVHKSLIDNLISRSGFMFDSAIPDIYSGFALSSIVKYYITLGIPVCMTGLSGKSIGTAFKYYENLSETIGLLTAGSRHVKGKFLANGVKADIESVLMDSFNCAKENLDAFSDIHVDIGILIKIVIETCYNNNKYCGNIGRENFQKELSIIGQVIENDAEYKANFIGGSLNICDYEFYEPIHRRVPVIYDGCIKFDASLFGIENIYDATLFAEKLLYSKEYIDVYLEDFEKKWEKNKSNFEWLHKYKKIGIFGAGAYTGEILKRFPPFGPKDADVFLFDNDKNKWGNSFCNCEVLPPESIPNHEIDVLLVSSPKFQDEIYEDVKKYEQTMEIVKLYEKLGESFSPGIISE